LRITDERSSICPSAQFAPGSSAARIRASSFFVRFILFPLSVLWFLGLYVKVLRALSGNPVVSSRPFGYTVGRKGVRCMLPYTIDEITRRITPVAQKYRLSAVWLFGSYARGEATADSDVDLLVDLRGSEIKGLNFVSLYNELEAVLGIGVDIVTADSLQIPTTRRGQLHFREAVNRERMMIYAAA